MGGEMKIHFFVGFLYLFCLFALIGCDTLNNGTFAENDLFSRNNQKIIEISDNRFNGVFQQKDGENIWGIKYNGTNIAEFYISIDLLNTGEKYSSSGKLEFELYNNKYRIRSFPDDEWGWGDWIDYDFSDDCDMLIFYYETSSELLEKCPFLSPIFIRKFEKIN